MGVTGLGLWVGGACGDWVCDLFCCLKLGILCTRRKVVGIMVY
jgi:hypothetical protein